MPQLKSKKIGAIPSNTFDTYVEVGIKTEHAGNARSFLCKLMSCHLELLPNIVMVKQGQEKWTSNIFQDQDGDSGELKPYKTKLEIRIYGHDKFRAKQELVKLITLWKAKAKEFNLYKIYRFGKDWSD